MIPVYYDLHIHSALSPCADNDMTPNDIVGMALLNGLNLIAVTDHNSFANTEAVINVSKDKDIIVLPGAEISTAEEVHVLCLFSDLISSQNFEAQLASFYSQLQNRVDIFGNQLIFDKDDRVINEVERMLIAPTLISFDDLYSMVNKFNGAFIPAHIDRDSFSVLSNLGFLPPHLLINTIEVSQSGIDSSFTDKNLDILQDKNVIISSDAHQLWKINEKINFINLPERTAKAAIDFLR